MVMITTWAWDWWWWVEVARQNHGWPYARMVCMRWTAWVSLVEGWLHVTWLHRPHALSSYQRRDTNRVEPISRRAWPTCVLLLPSSHQPLGPLVRELSWSRRRPKWASFVWGFLFVCLFVFFNSFRRLFTYQVFPPPPQRERERERERENLISVECFSSGRSTTTREVIFGKVFLVTSAYRPAVLPIQQGQGQTQQSHNKPEPTWSQL